MIILDLFLWFLIYSFVGWVWETLQFTIHQRRFVNRGFLNGPLLPLYGLGGLLNLLLLRLGTDNLFALFIAAVIFATALEYATAVILEKVFQAKWWDYSSFPLNYKGRIGVISSLVFGLMALLQLRYAHPFLAGLTGSMPVGVKMAIFIVGSAYLLTDLTLTVRHIFILNGRLSEIQLALNGFFGKYQRRAGNIKNAFISFEDSEFCSDRIRSLFDMGRIQNTRLLCAFPKLRSFMYDDALKKLREKLGAIRKR